MLRDQFEGVLAEFSDAVKQYIALDDDLCATIAIDEEVLATLQYLDESDTIVLFAPVGAFGDAKAPGAGEKALELLRENRERLGAANMTVVPGLAPEACRDLPAPTHVFIGGSGGNMREILALAMEKNPRVRIVATAVTLETVGELTRCMKELPFSETEAVALTVARDRKAGDYHLLMGQNPVFIFTLQAGGETA